MIEQNKDLRPLTTFNIAAKARYYAEYSSIDELRKLMRSEVYRNNEVLHIGEGSNLLFTEDYDGLILKSNIFGRTVYRKDDHTAFAIAGAGENWDEFVAWTIEQGLSGLENLSLIPGQVGAAAVQNIGAYGVEVSDVIHAVEVFDTLTGEIRRIKVEECKYGYRDSIFKHEAKGIYYVLRVSFRLIPDSQAHTLTYGPLRELASASTPPTPEQVREEIIKIRREKLPDPATTGSAGSFFKNPVVDKYYFEQAVRHIDPTMPAYELPDGRIKLSAAWLIDHAGLKGVSTGGAEIWPRQCLVIANKGNATANDVIKLADMVRHDVKAKYFVDLQPEVNYISSGIEVTVLGSGTSKGVPEIGCRCDTCLSEDTRDKRLRSSVLIRTAAATLLIDPSPDFRQQALLHGIDSIDAVLITHSHYDHVGGLDDLRPFCVNNHVPIYAQKDVIGDLKRRLDYCFTEHPYPGVPVFDVKEVEANRPFYINGIKILPIRVMHGRLPILAYRIGNFAYVTDASEIDIHEMDDLANLQALIINSLRHKNHFAHYNLEQALEVIQELKPAKAWLTHMSHEMGRHAEIEPKLPDNVKFAYDGLEIKIK